MAYLEGRVFRISPPFLSLLAGGFVSLITAGYENLHARGGSVRWFILEQIPSLLIPKNNISNQQSSFVLNQSNQSHRLLSTLHHLPQ